MHPILFSIGGFHVALYGPLIAIGILLGVTIAVRRAGTIGVSADLILDLTFWCVIIGFAGSRLFYILSDLSGFGQYPLRYVFSREGYVFVGGLIFGLAFAVWFLRYKGADHWQIGDIMAPSIALGHAFGRIGCFFSGCCYGRICPPGWEGWGVRFPRLFEPTVANPGLDDIIFSFAYTDHYADALLRGQLPEATHSLPVFPVQLFETAGNFLVFAFLLWLWRRRRFRGQIFAAYLGAYGILRFLIEFARGDYDDPVFGQLLERGQLSQLLSLAGVVVAGVIILRRLGTPLESPVPAAAESTPSAVPQKHDKPEKTSKRKRRRRR